MPGTPRAGSNLLYYTVPVRYRYSTGTGKKTPGGTVPVLYCTGALTGLRREPPPITGTGSCQYKCIGRYLKRRARKFQCPFHTHRPTLRNDFLTPDATSKALSDKGGVVALQVPPPYIVLGEC